MLANMCDTMVIVGEGRVLFAKNSDRDANEAQVLEWHPRREYGRGARLRCTWIEVPQAERTHAVLISRPFWLWGAEMGANEHGVAIGNEAIFTNQPYAKTGLTGMDLLRLALERAESAQQACDVIAGLLETHGQGGGCGYENRRFMYHNSFLIADPRGAIVLETAGRHWSAERVTGPRSISNALTIPRFAETYSDRLKTAVAMGRARHALTTSAIAGVSGVAGLFAVLRSHGAGKCPPRYSWLSGGMCAPCVHAGGAAVHVQTTASWVAELAPGACRHWVTSTSAPCTSLFKPVYVDRPLGLAAPGENPDQSLWWRHERLHRMVVKDPEKFFQIFEEDRDAIERRWVESPPDSAEAFAEHDRLLDGWIAKAAQMQARDTRPFYVRAYWRKRERAIVAKR
ncbi:MAG: C69 family dipeptidase [Candidatus Hydrogenedentes bacterium]|nr:C69 family dipeptidase [Candidatus Hydrogenedentota bacterium]